MEAYRVILLRISEHLTTQDVEEILFLLENEIPVMDKEMNSGAKVLLTLLERNGHLSSENFTVLRSLLRAVNRKDLVALLDKHETVKGSSVAMRQFHVSSYRKVLLKLSHQLNKSDLEKMKFLVGDNIGAGILENISTPLQLICELERIGKVRVDDLTFLQNCLKDVPRMDLASVIEKQKAVRNYGLRHLPADFIERSQDVSAVTSLLEEGNSSVTVLGKRCNDVVGIKGMGGLGKTVLAQAVCWVLSKSRQIIWLTMSQTPDILSLLNTLATALLGQKISFSDQTSAQSWIQEYSEDRDSLVVLDDVWDVNHATAFDVLSGQCQILITTRNSDVVRGLRGSSLHKLSQLDKDQARALLLKSAQIKEKALPQRTCLIAENILKECNGLPLAIALVGASLVDSHMDVDVWQDRLDGLKEADLQDVRSYFPENSYPYESLMAAIDVSYKSLPERYRRKFLELAVFPEDTELPTYILDMVWSDKSQKTANDSVTFKVEKQTRDDSNFLERRSLIQSGSTGRCFVMHDILLDFARGKVQSERGADALTKQHKSLLEKYRSRCRDGRWSKGPKEDYYYFQKLAYHLCEAGHTSELSCLLKNFDWLQTKLEQTDFASLLSDFAYLKTEEEDVGLVRNALKLSSHVLSQRKEQLGVQLLGRLEGLRNYDAVKQLTEQIRQNGPNAYTKHLVPLNRCLTSPGGPLIRTTDGRSRTILSIVITLDRQKIVTGSSDSNIKVWDFDSGKELQKLTGHRKPVYALAVFNNGATLVSGSFDCTIKIWNLDQFKLKRTLLGHGDWVTGVLITTTEERIISCSNDSTIRVWELETGITLYTLTGHVGHVRGIALTPDGSQVVSGSHDCTVKLWSLETFQTVRTLVGHRGTVYCVCVTPDGKHVISGSDDSTVKIWLLSSGEMLRSLNGHSAEVYCVAVTSDNTKIISSGDDRTIRVWSVATGQEIDVLKGHSESVRTVTVTRDGTMVVSGSQDFSYKVWDLTVASKVEPFIGHQHPITAVAIAPDSSFCLTASRDNMVKVWDCQRFQEMGTLKGHRKPVSTVALHPTEKVAASGSEDCQVKIWNLAIMSESLSFSYEHLVEVVKFSQNGEMLMCAFRDNIVALWDCSSETPTQWIEAPFCGAIDLVLTVDSLLVSNGYSMASRIKLEGDSEQRVCRGPNSVPFPALVLPSGSGIISGSSQGNHLRFWETNTSLEERTLCDHPPDSIITALDATKNEREVLTCSDRGTISVLDLQSGKVLYRYECFPEENMYITVAKWLPDERHFVVGNSLGELSMWSKTNGRMKMFKVFEGKVTNMAVLPNGHIVVAGESKLLLLHCGPCEIRNSCKVVNASVSALDVHRSGHFIVTGSTDQSVRTWEVIGWGAGWSLKPMYQLNEAHKFEVTAVAFGMTEDITFSGSLENTVIKWDMKGGNKLMEFRCSSLGWRVNCISIVDDRVFACFQDSTAKVWSLSDGKPIKQLYGRGGRYHVAKVLPERNRAFSDGPHYTLQLWSLKPTGSLLASFIGHMDEVTSLCLLPGVQHVITGSRDKTLKLWSVPEATLEGDFFFEQAVLAVACSDTGLVIVGLGNGQLCFMQVE